MLENAIYSVISPEGCATILWRDPKKMLDAAKAMKLSAKDLLKLKVIDEIIPEPLGGAHRDRDLMLDNVRKSISTNLDQYKFEQSSDLEAMCPAQGLVPIQCVRLPHQVVSFDTCLDDLPLGLNPWLTRGLFRL